MSAIIDTMVPIGDLPAFIRKHGKGRDICLWLAMPARDADGSHPGRDLQTYIDCTKAGAIDWAVRAQGNRPDAHVHVSVDGYTLFID